MVNGKITLSEMAGNGKVVNMKVDPHKLAVNGRVNLRHEVFVNLKVDLHELAVIGKVYLHGMRQL